MTVYQGKLGEQFRLVATGSVPNSFRSVVNASSQVINISSCESERQQCPCTDPSCNCDRETQGAFTCTSPTNSDLAFLIPVLVSLGACLVLIFAYFVFQFVHKYKELKRKEQEGYAAVMANAADFVTGLPYPIVSQPEACNLNTAQQTDRISHYVTLTMWGRFSVQRRCLLQ